MNITKEELVKSIIVVSEYLNIRDNVKLMLHHQGIDTTIKELIYYVFINDLVDKFEDCADFEISLQIIKQYCLELKANGEVVFTEPF